MRLRAFRLCGGAGTNPTVRIRQAIPAAACGLRSGRFLLWVRLWPGIGVIGLHRVLARYG